MVRNIFFDLGGVIVPLNRRRCLAAFTRLGVDNFGEYLNSFLQKGFFAKFENGDISSAEFRDAVRMLVPGKEIDDNAIDGALNEFLDPIPPEKIQYILQLKKEYRIFLLSNNNPISMDHIGKMVKEISGTTLGEIFEQLFYSYKLNLSKPGEAIFKKVIELSGVLPQQSLFIDDGPANIETASELGFKTLLYDTSKPFREQIEGALGNG